MDVPTNLDYVPQFLRWYDEWAEEFCRIKNIKIGKVKNACRGEKHEKDCSREGYDCRKTNIKRNEIFVDLDCPRCEKACTSYNEWIENKQKEFNKQKKKYEMEFNGTQSHGNLVNGSYDKRFYNELKNTNKHDSFFELLNKGKICENVHEKNKIDHNYLEKTFSRSEYCKSCPILGAECKNGQCNSFNDITCTYVKGFPNRITDKNNDAFVIDILLNDNKIKKLSPELKGDFNDCDLFKTLRKQNWNCKYKCNLHVCELKNFYRGIDDERFVSIDVLIKRWLQYFLKDYNKIKEKLNRCMNNEKKQLLCIKDCYKKCDCVEKWITKKRGEWQNIKERYLKRYRVKNEDIADELKEFLKQDLFTNYVKNALEEGETLDKMKEPDGCNELNKPNRTPCKNNDVITILLNRLKKKIETCKSQHKESNNQNCLKTLPPPPRPRGRRLPPRRRRVVRRVRVPRARQGGEREAVEKKEEDRKDEELFQDTDRKG
ncbi:pfEMP1 [Plasmodium falciparum HB3]|uniref:PfEMP1 n=1 Tax=Plasmodium falciparum (isolate HB3) TaxID=137071 RepID=A0A0L7KL70_PLAFX|nr:pfEMP1 [Plasmodium falciparum HB3]